jgi:hypothetical protein
MAQDPAYTACLVAVVYYELRPPTAGGGGATQSAPAALPGEHGLEVVKRYAESALEFVSAVGLSSTGLALAAQAVGRERVRPER